MKKAGTGRLAEDGSGAVGVFAVTISGPTPNSTVPPNFAASGGYTSPDTAVNGYLERNGTPTYPSVTSYGNGSWSMTFTGVSLSPAPYTLRVFGNSSGEISNANISVLEPT